MPICAWWQYNVNILKSTAAKYGIAADTRR